jgi:hypothetical protein
MPLRMAFRGARWTQYGWQTQHDSSSRVGVPFQIAKRDRQPVLFPQTSELLMCGVREITPFRPLG